MRYHAGEMRVKDLPQSAQRHEEDKKREGHMIRPRGSDVATGGKRENAQTTEYAEYAEKKKLVWRYSVKKCGTIGSE